MDTTLYFSDYSPFILNVDVGGNKETIDIKKAMAINQKNLPEECAQQPGWFAWYSALLATQESKLAALKRDLEEIRATMSLELRQGKRSLKGADDKEVKLTEGGIDNYILTNSKYQTIQNDLFSLEEVCKKLRLLVAASVQRKDMIIQLALLSRQEMRNFGGPLGQ